MLQQQRLSVQTRSATRVASVSRCGHVWSVRPHYVLARTNKPSLLTVGSGRGEGVVAFLPNDAADRTGVGAAAASAGALPPVVYNESPTTVHGKQRRTKIPPFDRLPACSFGLAHKCYLNHAVRNYYCPTVVLLPDTDPSVVCYSHSK